MGKNSSVKNFSLAAFVGLFALYNFNSYNIRVGSVSSKGLVIKYSQRGIASISCPPVSAPIDKVVADSLAGETCRHHVASKKLENGDVEYTVTSYFKGHITEKTKVFPAQEIASQDDHNVDFIKSVVRASKKKFDAAPKAEDSVELAQAEVPKSDSEETPAEARQVKEEKPEESQRPEINKPTVTASADENEEDGDSDFDADELMESIEAYAKLKIAYNSCSEMDKTEEKKLKKLIRKYDRGLKSYLNLANKYEDSDRDKNPLTRFVAKNESKLSDFMAEVDEFDSTSGDADFDEDDDEKEVDAAKNSSKSARFNCLLKRSNSITDKKAQFAHYSQNIQPMIREAGQTGSIQEFEAFVEKVKMSPINGLAQSNPYINSSLQSDLLGSQTQARLADNTKRMAEAQKLPEPVKTNTLRVLNEERTSIKSAYEVGLTEIEKNSPAEMNQDISGSGQFWAQQMLPLDQLVAQSQNGADATKASTKSPINDKVMEELDALYKRIAESKQGTGNSRRGAVAPVGAYNINTQKYEGRSVPQVGDVVPASALQ